MKRVAGVVLAGSGIHFHRIVNPFAYMEQQDDIKFNLVKLGPNEKNVVCDVLVYNKWIGMPVDEVKQLQGNGMKIVVDVDDYWDIPATHPNYHWFKQGGIAVLTEEHIRLANVVTCTTNRLRDQILPLNKNVVVIPNALPFDRDHYQPGDRVRAREISGHDKLRFMYLGGITHAEDIGILEGKFQRIGGDDYIKNRAEFLLCGYVATHQDVKIYDNREDLKAKNDNCRVENRLVKTDADYMAEVFRRTNSFRIYPSVDLENYLNYYDSADVAIAPLQDTFWNSMKSELKVIEAAAKHVPIIASKVAPYSDMKSDAGIIWVTQPKQWLEHIRYCIKNPEYVKEQGEQLYEQVSKDYDLININKLRMQVFNSL